MKNLRWFTFVELIVSMFISSLLLWSVFYFISANVEDIFLSNQRTEFYSTINDFRNEILNISSVYNSWSIVYNNAVWSWSDALLLQSKVRSDGYLIWVVYQWKILIWYNAYNAYGDKNIWYVRVSSWQIATFASWATYLNQIIFDDNHVFDKLKVRDFQADLYNSWNIINMDLTLLQSYVSSLDWLSRSDPTLKWTNFFKINLDF